MLLSSPLGLTEVSAAPCRYANFYWGDFFLVQAQYFLKCDQRESQSYWILVSSTTKNVCVRNLKKNFRKGFFFLLPAKAFQKEFREVLMQCQFHLCFRKGNSVQSHQSLQILNAAVPGNAEGSPLYLWTDSFLDWAHLQWVTTLIILVCLEVNAGPNITLLKLHNHLWSILDI